MKPRMSLPDGTKIGDYEIIGPLGAGNMGEVYRARDIRLNRDVAIKVLPKLVSADHERLQRFEIEAKATAALSHPNILSIFQMGTHDGVPYLVSELLEGKTLAESLRRGPLPLRQAIQFGVQVAHGLAAAHEKEIVHRDLKPENLFITKEGRVKILDFGLAKVTPSRRAPTTATTITRLGVAMGTVGYMSPEQVRGQVIDHRTDIFAFGAILYEMVTGQRAFQRDTEADTISSILNEEPPSISQLSPEIPLALERVIRRCLEKNPEQRFQSASDLAFALEALSEPGTITSGAHPIPVEPPKPRRLPSLAGGLILLLLGGFLAYLWLEPPHVPTVANYVQLTHDGKPKSLIGTDGARLYLAMGIGSSASFSLRGIAELSIAGGLPKKIDLTTSASADMVPLGLSPDGSEILLIEGQGAPPKGPLSTVSVLGGAPRRIGDFIAETGAWSPDGKLLAYTNLGDLYIAKADGSESRKITLVSGDIRNVTWSPNSSHLRFDSSETAGTVGLQIEREVSVDGRGQHFLLPDWHNPPDECCGKWTADGKYFVFQSQGQIWALPKNSGIFQSAPKPIQLTFSPMTLSSPLPSKDGKKLFVIGRTYRGEMVRYDSRTSEFVSFLGGISAEYVDFSKDGQWITYTSYPEGTLWRSRIDGSGRLQLTFPPLSPLLPRWSPDGKTILFFQFAQGADKPARIYEVSPAGGSPRLLLPDDRSQQLDPNWSPDGSKIIFSGQSNDPSSSIRIFDVSTRQLSTLPGSDGLFSPRWSPDGRHVSAFSADSRSLLLFDSATSKWRELASGSLRWLNWSHDSQYVYVLDFRQESAVIRVRISDGKRQRIADVKDFPATGRYGSALALTPDDQPVLLRDTGTQDVYSVDWRAP
jgi:serine/threonine protein kinase/Tol biopolymer transport system component